MSDNTEQPSIPPVFDQPAVAEQPVVPPVPQKPENPLLQRIRLPGEIHRLPSGGLFYKDGELDSAVTDGEVQIFPMTAIDEVVMRSPDLMFSGDAVEQVVTRCVPQILQPRRLLQKDVDFLLTAIRKVSYGEDIQLTLTHTCEDAKTHQYSIPLDPFIRGAKKLDPTNIIKNFTVKLPNNQVVVIHPLRYDAVVDMMLASGVEKDPQKQTDELVAVLVQMTESVDDITDPDMIHEWYETIPVLWSEKINSGINAAADWGPDFHVSVKCKDCGEEFDIDAPLNPISFFF